MHKVVRVRFADFISFSEIYQKKWNNLVSLRPNYFIFVGHLKTDATSNHLNPLWTNHWCMPYWDVRYQVHVRVRYHISLHSLNVSFIFKHALLQMSHGMRFPTMWYVRQAKPQISLRIRAVWSEPLLVACIFYECWATDWTKCEDSKLISRLYRLLWVYTCQSTTLLEITCYGSNASGVCYCT